MVLLVHMTEKIPPVNEALQENLNLNSEKGKSVEVDHVAMEDLEKLDSEIKFRGTETAEMIRDAQSKKELGSEPWSSKPMTVYNASPKQAPSNKFHNSIMALKIGLAGLLGLGATKEAKAGGDPVDSLGKKLTIEKTQSGKIEVKEGVKIRPITAQERMDWNKFLDFVKEKGYEGSKELDKGNDALARRLFDEFKKLNPNTTINYDIVAPVQYEMHKIRQMARGFAERHKDPMANVIMSGISDVDKWFGSKTSQYRFPAMFMDTYHNDKLVSSENLGLLGADLTPEKKEQIMKKVPLGKKLESLEDGYYYENDDGDLIKVSNK